MKSPQYTQEFKEEVVRQVLEGQDSLVQVARALGVNQNTLSTWKKTTRKWQGDPSVLQDGEEAPQTGRARLRRKNRQLKMEQAILKKAMGIVSRAR
ncbi:MAG: transposase [Armatimonadetes bacterium]|nr:transposase [Armatimonadota bacterium]